MTIWHAIVVGSEQTSIDGYQPASTPAGFTYDPAHTLDMIRRHVVFGGEATLLLPHAWISGDARHLALQGGWAVTNPIEGERTMNGWGAWTTFRYGSAHEPACTIHVGITPLIDPDRTPLFDPSMAGEYPAYVAHTLTGFHRATGHAWYATAGTVALKVIRRGFTDPRVDGQPLWRAPALPDGIQGAGVLNWERQPSVAEQYRFPYVVAFDLNAAYLAAAQSVRLPWGALLETFTPERFDHRWPGFWKIRVDRVPLDLWEISGPGYAPTGRPPLLNGRLIDADGWTWVSGPIYRELQRVMGDDTPVPGLALCAMKGREILRPFAERLNAARASQPFSDLDGVEAGVKGVWSELSGMLGRPGGRIYRDDWRWLLIDQARANLIRKIRTTFELTGRWPLRVQTDAVWYASETPDPEEAGRALGMKVTESNGPLGTWKPAPAAGKGTPPWMYLQDWRDSIETRRAARAERAGR